jgi:hypothetical protein
MDTLTLGTKEFYPIKLTDILNNLTTLDGLGLQFRMTKDDEAETEVVAWTSCLNDVMIALPLIDTTTWDDDDEGDYDIFLKFTIAPEIPVLGPFTFRVDD